VEIHYNIVNGQLLLVRVRLRILKVVLVTGDIMDQ
jgi:hypothetical protein